MKTIFAFILLIFFTINISFAKPCDCEIIFDLREKNGLYFVPIQLNGKKTWFLVDTGASISLLDVNQSKKYDFEFIQDNNNYVINGIGGEINRYRVYGYETKYDETDFNINLNGGDLKSITRIMRKDSIFIVGIIGVDFLRRYNAVISYKDKTLTINYNK